MREIVFDTETTGLDPVQGHRLVEIGDDCIISNCNLVDTDYHNLEPHLRHEKLGERVSRPIRLGRNVWVGANANILKGVIVGENSVVGLGSVVRGSVPANVVVIGNPAVIAKRSEAERPADRRGAPAPGSLFNW